MARVTGIGGVFLRAHDPKALSAWYSQHLGIPLSDYGGANFLWADEVPRTTGMTAWNLFPADTKYFGPGKEGAPQAAMVNYRVDDVDALLLQLDAAGVSIAARLDRRYFERERFLRGNSRLALRLRHHRH